MFLVLGILWACKLRLGSAPPFLLVTYIFPMCIRLLISLAAEVKVPRGDGQLLAFDFLKDRGVKVLDKDF